MIRTCLFLLLSLLLVPAPGTAASRLGLDPAPDVLLAAETSEALCAWFKAGYRGRPLVLIAARLPIASTTLSLPLDRDRLAAVLSGRRCADLRARVGARVREDALYDPDNYLVPAHVLGVVREVWWVVPARERLPDGELTPFREWLRTTLGLPEEFLGSLRHEGASVSGVYRGLPVRIVTLADLPPPTEPVLVTIDAEYLMKLYDNPVRQRLVDVAGEFFAALQAKALPADLPVVASAHERGRVPMGYAYVAGWVRDFLADPTAFAKGPPEAWNLQAQVEYLDFMLSRDEALAEASRLAALEPASPVPLFDQAWIAASRGDSAAARRLLEDAIDKDPRYRFGYLTLAGILLDRDLRAEAEALLESGCARFPGDLDLGLPLADLYVGREAYLQAASLLATVAAGNPGYPAAHAVHAFALRAAGMEADAAAAMERFRRSAPPGGMREGVLAAWLSGGQDELLRSPADVVSPSTVAPPDGTLTDNDTRP